MSIDEVAKKGEFPSADQKILRTVYVQPSNEERMSLSSHFLNDSLKTGKSIEIPSLGVKIVPRNEENYESPNYKR